MANGKHPEYEAFISQPGKENGKAFYTKIGAAWVVASDGISIKLNALPINGSLVLFPRREEEHE